MNPELSAALLGLALLIVASIGTLIKALVDRVLADLAENTRITNQAKDAANGRLAVVMNDLAKERNRIVALRALLREREDRIAYLEARLPQAGAILSEYGRRREDRHSMTEENRVLQQLMDDIDDPTGTDAGANRRR